MVKRLVHNVRRGKGEEGIPERRRQPTKKKLPYLFIEADEDHVPLQEKGKGGKGRKKRRRKSRILAKLVYVHEGREVSSSGRVELQNPHYFAGCYEDTEELFLEVLEYLEENSDLQSVEAIFLCGDGAPPQERPGGHPPIHLVLPCCHLGKRIREALSRDGSEEKLWKAIEEGSWENVEAFFSQEKRVRKNDGNSKTSTGTSLETREGIQNARNSQVAVSAEAHGSLSSKLDSPIVPWASGGREETADIFRALQFNGCSVRHDFLRTQRQHLPPFTLSPEPIKKEQERGKEVFREVYNTTPVMRKA